jgi:hypothetical protein
MVLHLRKSQTCREAGTESHEFHQETIELPQWKVVWLHRFVVS